MRAVSSFQNAEKSLRERHARLKPELQRLVLMCDLVARALRERRQPDAPRLLNELCDAGSELPSELDVRAAAVRIFSDDAGAPHWLRPSKGEQPEAAQTFSHDCDLQLALSKERLQGLQAQYRRTQLEMGKFYQLCESLFRKSKDKIRKNLKHRREFEEMLMGATGLSLEDVRAAATRLGLETEPAFHAAEALQATESMDDRSAATAFG